MMRLLWLSALLFIIGTLHAQTEWTVYNEVNGVTISQSLQNCSRPADGIYKEYYLLKYTNGNNYDVVLQFNRAVWYNGQCTGCDGGDEHQVSITLPANDTLTGECTGRDKAYMIFNRMLDNSSKSVLEKFELRDITVTKL